MPDGDVLSQVVPAISAAVGAYGAGVLTRAEDATADSTVRLGQRLLARILRQGKAVQVEEAVRVLAEAAPDEEEIAQDGLRLELRRLLRKEPGLVAELAELLPPAPSVVASGERAIAVGGSNSGIISTGDNAINIQRS